MTPVDGMITDFDYDYDYVWMHVSMYVCMYVCMYIRMYVPDASWHGAAKGDVRSGGVPAPLGRRTMSC